MLVCNDSLGIVGSRRVWDSIVTRAAARCVPCIPMGLKSGNPSARSPRASCGSTLAARHTTRPTSAPTARRWHSDTRRSANPDDPTIDVDFALFRLASANDSVRALGIARIDRTGRFAARRRHRRDAERVLGLFANGVWERAQRQLERPTSLPLDEWENRAHELHRARRRFGNCLRARASIRMEYAEAEWAARLYTRPRRLSDDPARRSAWHRLALAPWVVLRRWSVAGFGARAILATSPNDSTVLPGSRTRRISPGEAARAASNQR